MEVRKEECKEGVNYHEYHSSIVNDRLMGAHIIMPAFSGKSFSVRTLREEYGFGIRVLDIDEIYHYPPCVEGSEWWRDKTKHLLVARDVLERITKLVKMGYIVLSGIFDIALLDDYIEADVMFVYYGNPKGVAGWYKFSGSDRHSTQPSLEEAAATHDLFRRIFDDYKRGVTDYMGDNGHVPILYTYNKGNGLRFPYQVKLSKPILSPLRRMLSPFHFLEPCSLCNDELRRSGLVSHEKERDFKWLVRGEQGGYRGTKTVDLEWSTMFGFSSIKLRKADAWANLGYRGQFFKY